MAAAMSRIHRSLPPAGTRIGVAFSGGLDTRCAVAWFARSGLEVHCYTADLAQPDEASAADIPPVALEHGVEGGAPGRLSRRPGARRADRHSVRRLPPDHRRPEVLQHHAARPRGDHDRDHPRHARGRRERLLRRQHAQGQRHPALLPLRHSDQPGSHDLQAVARQEVRRGLRRPQGDERVPRPRSTCPTAWAPRRPTAPTPTCSAPPTRPRTSSSSTRACASSTRSWASPSGSPTSRSPPKRSRSSSTRACPCA